MTAPPTTRHRGEIIRIAHVVCSDGFAGVERYISKIAPALTSHGVDVTVIGGDVRAMESALAGSGADFRPAESMSQALAALRSLPSAPDIVNTHMSEADLVGWRFCRRVTTRQISTRHFGLRRGSNALSRTVFAGVQRSIAAQIAISRFVADAIEGESTVVHTGVDDCAADPAGDRTPTVLVAQRLEPEKDTELALRAWAAVGAPADGWQLQIAGEGSQRAELERLADGLGVAATTRFLGHRSDVGELMEEASLFLAPTPREGLGLSVLEAMARGLPVVASAGGGHLETVGPVADAALFTPGDVEAAAGQLRALIEDAVRRREYGARLQAAQRAAFGISAQVEGTLAVYERVTA